MSVLTGFTAEQDVLIHESNQISLPTIETNSCCTEADFTRTITYHALDGDVILDPLTETEVGASIDASNLFFDLTTFGSGLMTSMFDFRVVVTWTYNNDETITASSESTLRMITMCSVTAG